VSPTLEVLGRGVVETLGSSASRVHVGVPISAEIDRGPARLYAGTGFFSRGIWFVGGGAGVRTGDSALVSIGWSRSWRTTDTAGISIPDRARNELTGSVAYAVTQAVALFGSIVRTIATTDENGAGTTVSAGIAFSFTTRQ